MAAGIEDLALPSLAVPDLFRQHKIVNPPGGTLQGSTPGNSLQSSAEQREISVAPAAVQPGIDPPYSLKKTGSPPAPFRRPSLRSSRSVNIADDRCSTPELDSGDSSSDTSETASAINGRSYARLPRMKHVNPNIVESYSIFHD